MSLGLDLSPSIAKLARARIHLDALKREIPVVISQRPPYSLRFSEVDPESGWTSIFLTPGDFTEFGLGVLVGDLVYNLRCALDYIISALVEASGGTVGVKHQFPIYTSAALYAEQVVSGSTTNAKGPLAGIVHGLVEIERLQPYKRKPDPEADPLFHIYRLSNADKHRQISAYMPLPVGPIQLKVRHNGKLLEQRVTPLPEGEAGREYEIVRLLFARPFPASPMAVDAEIVVRVGFGTPPFAQHMMGHAVDIEGVTEMWEYAGRVIDLFKAL